MRVLLLLVVGLLSPLHPGLSVGLAAQGTVEGLVHRGSAAEREPVPFATVELLSSEGRPQVASADGAGHYRFADVAAGRYTLRVTHIGFRTYETSVGVTSSGLRLDIALTTAPVRVPGVEVRGTPQASDAADSETAGAIAPGIAMRMLEQGSGLAGSGIISALGGLPGGKSPEERDILLLRGSALDLKSVQLDGAPVYTPFHVGGLLPSFDTWLVEGGSVWLGAAPAEYDGGLNYILEMRTRRPEHDRVRASAGMDLLGARAGVSVPLAERGGLLLGGRGLHNGAESIYGRGPSPYGYRDALARLDFDVGREGSFRATGFQNREEVRLDYPAPGASDQLPDRAEWGNTAASAELVLLLLGGDLAWTGARSHYTAGLPLGGTLPAYASGSTTRRRSDLRLRWPRARGGSLRVGLGLEGVRGVYSARGLDEDGATRVFDSEADTWMWSAHGDLHRPLGTSGSLRVGARVSQRDGGRLFVAPRVGMAYSLSEQAVLAVSAGRYHQIVTVADQQLPAGLAEQVADPAAPPPIVRRTLFELAAANHLVVSLDQMLTPLTRLALDGYYKRFSNVGLGSGVHLASSGVDLRATRTGDRFHSWVGYSLSWHWTDDRNSADRFSGRQLLSAGVAGALSSWSGMDIALSYGSGLPLTAVADAAAEDNLGSLGPGERTAVNLPDPTTVAITSAQEDPPLTGGPSGDFLRLDARLHGTLSIPRDGRTHTLMPYIKVLNALDRRDALFYYFEPWRGDQPRPLAELSFLPVLGLEWRF